MNLSSSSLQGRLQRSLLSLVACFWIVGALGVAWYVDREIAEQLDSSLVQSANRLLELAAHELDEVRAHSAGASRPSAPQAVVAPPKTSLGAKSELRPEVPPEVPPEVLGGEFLMYQVVDASGQVQMRSVDAPASALAVPLQTGFGRTPHWRVYTLRHPVQALFIHVADPITHRQRARNESLLFLLLPLLAVLPLILVGVQRIVHGQMASVDRVTQEVRRRGGSNLAPVDAQGLPVELRELADNVNHLLERLDEALHAERALAANAAHELRTPLTVAQLRLTNALAQELPPAVRQELGAAAGALAQLKRRTEKLLQLSRAESSASMGRDAVQLNQVAYAVAREFENHGDAMDRLQFELGDEQTVVGDLDAMAIALRNLIENALRYSGQAQVDVCTGPSGVLRVRDHGPGVTPAQLQDLTARHVRFAQDQAGFGLGLSIVKTIVERHHARLVLLSPPPGQTTGFEAQIHWQQQA